MLATVPSTHRIGIVQATAFLLAVLVYLWLGVIPYPWTGAALMLAVAVSWWRRSESVKSLGLGGRAFLDSFRRWRLAWIACLTLFAILGGGALLRLEAAEHGLVYFAWGAAQQLAYQSMIYTPLRRSMTNAKVAAGLSGLAFALAHAPNPILVPATLLWGAVSSLLFERCRSIWGLALLQVMLSSMLFRVTPPALHRNFTIGPYYLQPPPVTFAPPIGANGLGGH